MHTEHLGDRYIASKGRHVRRSWTRNDFFWSADLFEDAVFHHCNAVTESERFVEVVGDEHDGSSLFCLQPDQLVLHVVADQRVESRERLIEEQNLWVERKRAGEPNTLLHPARQLVGVVVGPPLEADERQNVTGDRSSLALVDALHFQAVGSVVDHLSVWEKAKVLKHHGELGSPQFT